MIFVVDISGNSFLVSVTLADLLVTALVLPATSVAILAKTENAENLCRFQYGVTTMACVTASMFSAVVGIENFLRLKALRHLEYERQQRRGQASAMLSIHLIPPPEKQSLCTQFQVTVLNLKMWLLSGIIVLVHFFLMPHLMLAICGSSEPVNEKELLDSIIVLGVCLLAFVSLGGLGFIKCVCIMRSWEKPMPYITAREFSLISSNFWNWLARFLIWCPSIVAAIITQSEKSSMDAGIFPQSFSPYHQPLSFSTTSTLSSIKENKGEAEDNHLTFQRLLLIWPAILPSCISSLIYALANKDFRRCYIQLFNYCCCKTSVALTRRPRDNLRGGSDVRVHIIPGYNMYSSASGHSDAVTATPPRFNTFKCGPLMSCRRDVYEL